jgi:hypothetical protein
MVHACNISFLGGGGRIVSLRPVQAKLARPWLKNKVKTKRAGGIAPLASARPLIQFPVK